ncbi:MAG: S8 family serine peptidase [Acidobacteriota bacterium]
MRFGSRSGRAAAWLLLGILVAFAQPGLAADADTVRVLVRFAGHLPGAGERPLVAGEMRVRHEFPEVGALALEVPRQRLEELRRSPGVVAVEEDPVRYALGSLDGAELQPSRTNGLYGLVSTRAILVQKRGIVGQGATVCVADTGIDAGHPDIAPAFRGGVDEVDHDDNPDIGPHPGPSAIHGTHVAGTAIAALNGVGVRGVAYGAGLYVARVLGNDGQGQASDVMDGVRHLVEVRGCKVVSLSLGGTRSSSIEAAFYAEMIQHGALIVAAAGNEGKVGMDFPAGYPGVLAVGAVDSLNRHASFSNVGAGLGVSAPGVGVLSAVPREEGVESSVKLVKTTYAALGMEFAGNTGGITEPLVDCGSGNSPGEFPATVAGRIALIRRGDQTFAVKTQNAMDAGAVAAVVYNNQVGDFSGTLSSAHTTDGRDWIPVVGVSDKIGAALRRAKGRPVTLVNALTAWATESGTSMATPHVAGIAALLLGVNPALSAADLTSILEQTAIHLGGRGYNTTYGWGLVNADAAVRAAQRR